MRLTLGRLSARVDVQGAELRSLKCGDDEYLWQDEARVWPHSAPILFPFVGRLKGRGFRHAGRFHAMPIHGFAAQQRFDCLERRDHRLLLQLRDNLATYEAYPFRFCLQVCFTLQADGLRVDYEIRNEGSEMLPFTLGSHPAFALGAGPLDAWQLLFDQAELPEVYRLDGELLATEPGPLHFEAAQAIRLGPRLFDDDALIFKHIRSRRLTLRHRERGTRLCLHTGGAPHLGLWARPAAAYLCIEPWFGVDEDARASLELAEKPGLIRIAAGQRFATGYRVELVGTVT
ncbi:aldose 1-epimerase family protein [Pelomonas sp. V22]|uniref:aldose 1-epimerase family protein n=1 Tax=Pelomonas sp. V22 TaxID=2822139 RepID=UPI0024A8B692|nr:aldose 1-epimerase family protein [Pelomonas sp. V22]MDI4632417.1 aldose 1-epimerase family protein [Pelomonas sp. V22]